MRTRVAGFATFALWIGLAVSPAAIGQQPPKEPGTAPLARYFPRKDLVVYAEFDGLDAHRDAWTKTAAYRILNETTTGAMLEQTFAHLLDMIESGPAATPPKGRDLVALGKRLLHSGFAVGINRAGGVGLPRSLAVVVRGGGRGASRAAFDRFLKAGEGPHSPIKPVDKPGGRKVQMLDTAPGKALAWWVEGDDLVVSLVSASGVDAVVATLDGREPSAVDHPTRLALKNGDDAPGFEPVGLAFFEMAALPPLPREGVALGLDRIERFDYRWGFHGKAIQSILGVVVPSPRSGIPALFDQPTFDVGHLPPLPGGLSGFTVLSLDAARLYDQLAAMMKVVDPKDSQRVGPFKISVKEFAGLKLREDILAPLGSQIVLYTLPSRIDAPPNVMAGLAHALTFAPRSTVVIDVKEPKAFSRVLEVIAGEINKPAPATPDQQTTVSFSLNTGSMKRLKGPEVGYLFPPSESSLTLPMGMRQTVLLGGKSLVWGMTPATARRARDLSERADAQGLPPGDPMIAALDQLPGRLTFLSVVDERRSILADMLVSVPNLIDSLPAWETFAFMGFPFAEQFSMMNGVPPGSVVAVCEMTPVAAVPVPTSVPGTVEPPVARNVALTPAFDPELIPEADDLRTFLFPSVSVLAVDDRGIRFISREAFPTINPATVLPVATAMLVPVLNASRVASPGSRVRTTP